MGSGALIAGLIGLLALCGAQDAHADDGDIPHALCGERGWFEMTEQPRILDTTDVCHPIAPLLE